MSEKNTGADFVRAIGPLGAAIFIAVFVLSTLTMLFVRPDPLKDYTPAYGSGYYEASPERLGDLCLELERELFPLRRCTAESEVVNGRILVQVEADKYDSMRSAILRFYNEELFEFRISEDQK